MADALTVLIGNAVKFSVLFTDEDGDEIDPTIVTFTVVPDSGSEVGYVYGVDPEIVRDSMGAYHIWIDREDEGDYAGYFAGTGNIKARGCAKVSMTNECQ